MIVSLKGKTFDFTVEAPPSKSIYHRELIVRFLLGDRGHLETAEGDSDDVTATKSCLKALLRPSDNDGIILPCNESGSTLRFMIPVASAYLLRDGNNKGKRLIFETKGRLFERPLTELEEALRPHGIVITREPETRRIIVTGNMTPGEYVIDGSVSSQYISGLLMALPLFEEDCVIKITGELKSVHYVELTLDVLARHGLIIVRLPGKFMTEGSGYSSKTLGELKVEGDWSNGAFLHCFKLLSGSDDLKITGLSMDSVQGDKAIMEFLDEAEDPSDQKQEFDCMDIPDIVPYMAMTAPFYFKKVKFNGISRLRIKECDRVMAIRQQLASVGVKTEETEDSLTVYKYENGLESMGYKPGDTLFLSSFHDHRMAMSALLLAAKLEVPVDIDDIECVNKSFPQLQDIIRREMMP